MADRSLTFGLGPRIVTPTAPPARLRRWPFWLSIPLRSTAKGPTRFASTAARTGPDPHRSGVTS